MVPTHVQLGKVPREDQSLPALNWLTLIARVAPSPRAKRIATTARKKAIGTGKGQHARLCHNNERVHTVCDSAIIQIKVMLIGGVAGI